MAQFEDRFAIVTGAGGGIGRAVAWRSPNEGATLWAVGRTGHTGRDSIGLRQTRASISTDLTEDSAVERLADEAEREFGRVDFLVHPRERSSTAPSPIRRPKHLTCNSDSNVRLPYRVTQSLLPLLRKRRGQIVFVNSSIVLGGARAGTKPVRASQHAVRAIAETLRQRSTRTVSAWCACIRAGPRPRGKPGSVKEETYKPELPLQPEDIATMVVAALALPSTAEVTDISIRPMLKSY